MAFVDKQNNVQTHPVIGQEEMGHPLCCVAGVAIVIEGGANGVTETNKNQEVEANSWKSIWIIIGQND